MNIAQVMTQVPAGVVKVTETLQLSTGRPRLCQIAQSAKLATTRYFKAFSYSQPLPAPTKTSAMASKQTLAFFLVAMLAVASTFELTPSS